MEEKLVSPQNLNNSSSSSGSDREYICAPEQMTVRSCEVWNELPEEIKKDPILASFREGYRFHYKRSESISPRSNEEQSVPDEELDEEPDAVKISPYNRYTKLTILIASWIFFTVILMTKQEHNLITMHQISVKDKEVCIETI
ncbi:uncharacterized protein LOC142334048 [Lycorma delicatula]|uniref:uncharacterized protein LOC142334048 n=1 Tax=Lycorma delicatula TaxID=130591 RepID=UPI003F51A8AB